MHEINVDILLPRRSRIVRFSYACSVMSCMLATGMLIIIIIIVVIIIIIIIIVVVVAVVIVVVPLTVAAAVLLVAFSVL